MDYTTEHLAAIRTAITTGELTVRYGDTSITYRSMSELLAAEARIERALAETRSQRPLTAGYVTYRRD